MRQIKILKSYSGLGKNIECLAAAQAITELTFLLVGNNDKQQNYLSCVLAHLDRIYLYEESKDCLLYTSPSPRDGTSSRMPSSA